MTKLERYVEMLKCLSPKGKMWEYVGESKMTALLRGIASEMVRIEDKAMRLLKERDPRAATELLPDWEELVGLPDDCQAIAQSIGQRRADVHRKFTARGGQSAAYYRELAAAFGYEVSIKNYRPFRAGRSRAGDQVWGPNAYGCWEVFSNDVVPVFFRVGQSSAGDPLRSYRNEILECVIRRASPAHTHVTFAYGTGE